MIRHPVVALSFLPDGCRLAWRYWLVIELLEQRFLLNFVIKQIQSLRFGVDVLVHLRHQPQMQDFSIAMGLSRLLEPVKISR